MMAPYFFCQRRSLPQLNGTDSIIDLPFPSLRLFSDKHDIVLSLGPSINAGGKPSTFESLYSPIRARIAALEIEGEPTLSVVDENGTRADLDANGFRRSPRPQIGQDLKWKLSVVANGAEHTFRIEWKLAVSPYAGILTVNSDEGRAFISSIAEQLSTCSILLFSANVGFASTLQEAVGNTIKDLMAFAFSGVLSFSISEMSADTVFCRVRGSDVFRSETYPDRRMIRALLSHQTLVFITGYSGSGDERSAFNGDVRDALAALGGEANIPIEPADGTLTDWLLPHNLRHVFVMAAINPLHQTVCDELVWTFRHCRGASEIHYAGHGRENGDWLLRDDDFTLSDLCDVVEASHHESNRNSTGAIYLNCCFGGVWTEDSFKDGFRHMYEPSSDHFFNRMRLDGVLGPLPLLSGGSMTSIRGVATVGMDLPIIDDDAAPTFEAPQLYCFPARNGECYLLVTQLEDSSTYGLLYDGGRQVDACAWPILRRCDSIDVVCSHVDNDHITGLLSIFRTISGSDAARVPEIKTLYMNCSDDALQHWRQNACSASNRRVRGLKDGNSLLSYTTELNVMSATAGCQKSQSMIDFYVVSPRDADKALESTIGRWSESHNERTTTAEKSFCTGVGDKTITSSNSACVCLLVIVRGENDRENRRFLLTGDAPQNSILGGLEALETQNVIERHNGSYHFDLVTVPHHGSSKNTDATFYQAIKAEHFVVSGNGRSFGGTRLPEMSTLLALTTHNPTSNVIFNYGYGSTINGTTHMRTLIESCAHPTVISEDKDVINVGTYDCSVGTFDVDVVRRPG